MALTLIEAAKANKAETLRSTVIEMFARASDWLANLPMMDIPGNAYAYNREASLPGVAFRGIGESYTESTGVLNPLSEALKVAGGDVDVDMALIKMFGMGRRATQTELKIKALSAEITRVLIKGDSESNPREFDGLQKRVVGSQLIENGSTSGGDPLSLIKLDEAIDAVPGANAIWLNKAMRRRITAAARTTSVGGFISYGVDGFGRQVTKYNDIPLYVPYTDNSGTEPVAFDEAGAGGGATATSLYVLRMGEGYYSGLQNGTMEVRDLGEMQSGVPAMRTRVEWLVAQCIEHGRAVARLRGISNAAVVA